MAFGSQDVFVNLPYDESIVDVYLAYLSGSSALGFSPRATLEISGSERRLDRTLQLIQECQYSVHELSPVPKITSAPRLNMAFELGLTVALNQAQPGHTWFVFESSRARLGRSLSDLGGTDAYFHGGHPRGIFRELGNAFIRAQQPPTVQEMEQVFLEVRRGLPEIKYRAGTRSSFTARVFTNLVVLARTLSGHIVRRKLASGSSISLVERRD